MSGASRFSSTRTTKSVVARLSSSKGRAGKGGSVVTKWIVLAVVLVVGYYLLTHLRVRGTTIGGLPFDIGLGIGSSGSQPSDATAQQVGAGLTGAASIIGALSNAFGSKQPTGTS